MPDDLLKAHKKLDEAVEACYLKVFNNEEERVEYLLGKYEKLAAAKGAASDISSNDDEESDISED